jgi:hypothetical protein
MLHAVRVYTYFLESRVMAASYRECLARGKASGVR